MINGPPENAMSARSTRSKGRRPVAFKRPSGLPIHPVRSVVGDRPPYRDVTALGALTMIIIVFLALVGQGCSPRDALAVTLAVGMGGTEVIRRLPNGRD